MRLLRRLIEYPIVLKKKNRSMGKNVMRAVKGIATGIVMIFVTTIAILMRDQLGEITASFIIIMSFIYALREIFKDDLRDILWRWIRKGKPKWRGRYYDPSTNKMVGHKIEWMDYTSYSKLPDRVQKFENVALLSEKKKFCITEAKQKWRQHYLWVAMNKHVKR